MIDDLGKKNVHFRSVMENIDTETSGGRLMFHMMAALAEFERAIISERTRAGLHAAKARGKCAGRPRVLTARDVQAAFAALEAGSADLTSVAEEFRVSVRTVQRYLRDYRTGKDTYFGRPSCRGVDRRPA